MFANTPIAASSQTGAPGSYQYGSQNDPTNYGSGASGANAQMLAMLNQQMPSSGNIQALVNQVNNKYGLPNGSSEAFYPDKNIVAASGGGYYAQAPGGGAWGYNVGDSGGGGNSGGGYQGGGGTGAGAGTTFNDPAYQALNALAQSRIAALSQPQSFPQLDQLTAMLTAQQAQANANAQTEAGQLNARATQLQQPLMTDANVVQQHALASNNLIGSRDAAIKNAQASLAARGIAPTSGLALDQANQVNQNYSNQQGNIDAQLQQANITTDENRRNEATQLQQLATQALQGGNVTALQEQAQNADLENQLYGINQNRQLQQLAAAQIPVDLTNQAFSNANGAAGNPSADLSSLMSLIGPSLYQQNSQFSQSNSQMSGIMQMIQQLLGAKTA